MKSTIEALFYHGDVHLEYFRCGEASSFFDQVSGLASQKATQLDILGLTGRPAKDWLVGVSITTHHKLGVGLTHYLNRVKAMEAH